MCVINFAQVLTKPVDLPRLLQKIAKLLEPVTAPPNSLRDRHLRQILLNRLCHQLNPPIYQMIGYSDLLLDVLRDSARRTLRERQQPDLASDIQKIHTSGIRILQLVQAMLNPVLLELQQPEIDIFTPTLRLEILTPLSTIIGYCEMLLEEVDPELVPDLEQIYTSARDLLSVANSLDSSIDRQLTSIQSLAFAKRLPEQKPFCEKIDPDDSSIAAHLSRSSSIDLPRSAIAKDRQILIVDNNESNSKLLSRYLERQESQVTISTIDRVFDTLAAGHCDLILLEIDLPESGLQVLAQLKQGEWRHIPVIILTAPDRMDCVIRGIEIGAADYLTKPFQSVLVETKVAACLELQRWQRKEDSFDSLFKNAPVGVYRATATGCYQQVNQALVKLLGYPDAATLMGLVTDIAVGGSGAFAPAIASRSENRIYVDRNRYVDFKTMLAEHDRVTGFEYQAYRYDGVPIWISEHARAILDPDGKLIAYEGIVEDISPRQQAKADLQAQLTALQLELADIKPTFRTSIFTTQI